MIDSARCTMLIRRPIEEVYEAFINPEVTSMFWFTAGSGKLIEGESVTWSWETYNLTIPVEVIRVVPNENIVVNWGEGRMKSTVAWEFKSLGDSKTFVTIINSNFKLTPKELSLQIVDSTGGFTMVLAGCKAWLEHFVQLNLVADKLPEELRR